MLPQRGYGVTQGGIEVCREHSSCQFRQIKRRHQMPLYVANSGNRFRAYSGSGRTEHIATPEYKTRNGQPRSSMDEDETNQAREQPGEILEINHNSEIKFQKNDAHETSELKGKSSNAT
ncbi:hypothetical protein TNCV_5074581 [Trichonephila clavipes]|nr:hypothetical protein TNCV_5074581 [Trichonephila clavipes]